jgi:hypothetical protein
MGDLPKTASTYHINSILPDLRIQELLNEFQKQSS